MASAAPGASVASGAGAWTCAAAGFAAAGAAAAGFAAAGFASAGFAAAGAAAGFAAAGAAAGFAAAGAAVAGFASAGFAAAGFAAAGAAAGFAAAGAAAAGFASAGFAAAGSTAGLGAAGWARTKLENSVMLINTGIIFLLHITCFLLSLSGLQVAMLLFTYFFNINDNDDISIGRLEKLSGQEIACQLVGRHFGLEISALFSLLGRPSLTATLGDVVRNAKPVPA